MPIKLKNTTSIPNREYDTVKVLGLEIPLTDSLPFGAQVEMIDLQQRHEAGEFGQFEFLMRLFCMFTRRLPKSEWVRYDWLAQQALEPLEMTELMEGTLALLNNMRAATPDADEGEGGGGNAPKPKARRGKTEN